MLELKTDTGKVPGQVTQPIKADFDIEYEHIPESFTAVDISVGERKHILLYTDAQIKLLSREGGGLWMAPLRYF